MKIANIILTSQNGGAEQVFIDYLKVFKELGHEVFGIVKNDAPYFEKAKKYCHKIVKTSNKLGFNDFIAVKNIKNFLENIEADVIFAHTGRAAQLTKKALKKIKNKKILLVAINHSMNVKRSIGADIILNVNRQIFYKTIDLGQGQDKSFVIPNALELSNHKFKEKFSDLTKRKNITLGVIGRLDDATKNFALAIKILPILQKKIKDKNVKLKIAGDGKEKTKLQNLAEKLGVEKSVEFLGWVKNKEDFYDQIDIFCLTSLRETFGLVLLEAMKFQKPIISTQADGPQEILQENIDALMVGFDNCEEEMTKAIIRLISEKNLAQNLVKNSTKRLQNQYSFTALTKRLKEFVG